MLALTRRRKIKWFIAKTYTVVPSHGNETSCPSSVTYKLIIWTLCMKAPHRRITWRSWCLGSCSTQSSWSCVGGRCRRRRWRADMPPAPETRWWSGPGLLWGGVSARGGIEVQFRKVKVICFINLPNETLKYVNAHVWHHSMLLQS